MSCHVSDMLFLSTVDMFSDDIQPASRQLCPNRILGFAERNTFVLRRGIFRSSVNRLELCYENGISKDFRATGHRWKVQS